MNSRRQCFSRFLCAALAFAQVSSACVAEESSHQLLVTPAADEAIAAGLNFLAGQQLDDGSFGARGYPRNVAVCALVGMAMLGEGSTPGRGEFGEELDAVVRYLLSQHDDAGMFVADDAVSRGPMYGHGFATLFLCEVYGMADAPELRERLIAAVDIILTAQNAEGGWRYQPVPSDADTSVTVCQVMALRAARNAGLLVPRESIDRAIAYVKQCQNADGGFRYMLAGGESQFARSAAGVVALYNAGVYDGAELQRGLDYLQQFAPGGEQASPSYYFYGHYYAAQAMWHAGGERWQQWYPAVRDELVARQRSNGSWMDAICPEYGTAMACIVLQVPNNFLPILQR